MTRRGLPIFLWLLGPLFELGGLFLLSVGMPDAIENVVLGPRVVQIIAGFSLVVAVVGAFFAWRGIAGAKRLITTLALSAAAGSTVALGIFFILSDGLAPFAVLMAQSALSIAMICRAALKSSSKEGRR